VDARDAIIEAHMRLVFSIARRFAGPRLELEDLVQEGVIGLIHAIDQFRPELGCQFATYATYWIRQSILRAVDNQARLIRIPVNVAYAALRVERAVRELIVELGREPTDDEIARSARVSARKVPILRSTPPDPLSLDAVLGTEAGEDSAGLEVTDESAPDPEQELVRNAERDALHALLECLPEQERLVLRERMGFADGQRRTLQEIATRLNVSREAVRRMEMTALRRLRQTVPAWLLPLCVFAAAALLL
jgi:RNA polymerase primary sigma factor